MSVAQVGVEPTASLCLKQRGLPIAYRAVTVSSGLASGRMTSSIKLRELESNQRLRVQSPVSLPAATTPQYLSCWSTPSGNRTRSVSFKGSRRDYAPERVSCGSRTRLSRLEAWRLCRSAKDTGCFSGSRGT